MSGADRVCSRSGRPPITAPLYPDGTNDSTRHALDSAGSGLSRLWTQQASRGGLCLTLPRCAVECLPLV